MSNNINLSYQNNIFYTEKKTFFGWSQKCVAQSLLDCYLLNKTSTNGINLIFVPFGYSCVFKPASRVQILSPWLGDKVDSGIAHDKCTGVDSGVEIRLTVARSPINNVSLWIQSLFSHQYVSWWYVSGQCCQLAEGSAA